VVTGPLRIDGSSIVVYKTERLELGLRSLRRRSAETSGPVDR
jgi:hypothetical protein